MTYEEYEDDGDIIQYCSACGSQLVAGRCTTCCGSPECLTCLDERKPLTRRGGRKRKLAKKGNTG